MVKLMKLKMKHMYLVRMIVSLCGTLHDYSVIIGSIYIYFRQSAQNNILKKKLLIIEIELNKTLLFRLK